MHVKMVRLTSDTLNTLFDELARWNDVLRHCDGLEDALAAIEQIPNDRDEECAAGPLDAETDNASENIEAFAAGVGPSP